MQNTKRYHHISRFGLKISMLAVLLSISMLLAACGSGINVGAIDERPTDERITDEGQNDEGQNDAGLNDKGSTGENATVTVAEPFLVQIRCGGLSGSGVILRADQSGAVIITAAHVVEQDPTKVTVNIKEDAWEVLEADECKIMEDSDLAFIRVTTSQNEAGEIQPVPINKASFDSLAYNDAIVLEGFNGGDPVRYEAQIEDTWIFSEDFNQYMMLLIGHGDNGMSGGPALCEDGSLAGIICGYTYDLDGVEYVAVLPLSLILAAETVVDMGN